MGEITYKEDKGPAKRRDCKRADASSGPNCMCYFINLSLRSPLSSLSLRFLGSPYFPHIPMNKHACACGREIEIEFSGADIEKGSHLHIYVFKMVGYLVVEELRQISCDSRSYFAPIYCVVLICCPNHYHFCRYKDCIFCCYAG